MREKRFKDAETYAAGGGTAVLGAEGKKKRRPRFPFKTAEVASGQTVHAYLKSCFDAQSSDFTEDFFKAVIDQVNDALRVRHGGQAGAFEMLDKDRLEDWRAREGFTAKRARASTSEANREEEEEARVEYRDRAPAPEDVPIMTEGEEGAPAPATWAE